MHLNLALAASIVSALSCATTVSALHSVPRDVASSVGSVLDERKIDTFFGDDAAHNTPRHARPIFQSAASHKTKKRHHHAHSKRARGTCKKKTSSSSSSSSDNNGSTEQKQSPEKAATPSSSSNTPKETHSSSGSSKTDTISPITSGSDALGGAGLFSFVDSKCGKSGATEEVTKTSGPNGAMDWLNCGVNEGGWTPPDVKMKDILVMSLDEALEEDNSPFKACQPYLSM